MKKTFTILKNKEDINFSDKQVQKARMLMQLTHNMDLFYVQDRWLWVQRSVMTQGEAREYGMMTVVKKGEELKPAESFSFKNIVKHLATINKKEGLQKVYDGRNGKINKQKVGFRMLDFEEYLYIANNYVGQNFEKKEICNKVSGLNFGVFTRFEKNFEKPARVLRLSDSFGDLYFRFCREALFEDFTEEVK